MIAIDIFTALLYIIFTVASLLLILVILLQEGSGGGLAGAFGGAGSEAFGVKAGGIKARDKALAKTLPGVTKLGYHPETGRVRSISGTPRRPLSGGVAAVVSERRALSGVDARTAARRFMERYGRLFGLRSPGRELRVRGIELLPGHAVASALGRSRVRGCYVAPLDASGRGYAGPVRELACDATADARAARTAEEKAIWEAELDDWTHEKDDFSLEMIAEAEDEDGSWLHPRQVLRELEKAMPARVMVSTDIGNINSVANSS